LKLRGTSIPPKAAASQLSRKEKRLANALNIHNRKKVSGGTKARKSRKERVFKYQDIILHLVFQRVNYTATLWKQHFRKRKHCSCLDSNYGEWQIIMAFKIATPTM